MLARPMASSIVACLTVTGFLFLANLALSFVPRAQYHTVAAEALRDGDLPATTRVKSAVTVPRYNYTDCIVLGMLLADRSPDSRIQQAVSPRTLTGPGRTVEGYCEDTAAAATTGESSSSQYHNYLHGYWTLSGALLAVMSFAGATTLLWVVSQVLGLALVALNLLAFVRTRNPSHAAFAFLGVGAALFTGRDSFSWSLTFVPTDIVISSFLLVWSLRRAQGVIGAAFLGALTAAFEFLLGAFPITAALLLISGAFLHEDGKQSRALETFAAFSLTFFLMFVLKAVAVALLFEPEGVVAAGTTLMSWTSSGSWQLSAANAARLSDLGIDANSLSEYRVPSFVFLLAKLAYFSPTLVFGSFVGGIVITVLLPSAMVAFGVVRAVRGDRRYWLILAGAAIIMGWYFVMLNHAIVHTEFMVRMLAWLGSIAIGVLAWELAMKHNQVRLSEH